MKKNKHDAKTGEVDDDDDDEMKFVHDSSLDYAGEIPLRSSTGSWKASFFIIGKNYFNIFMHIRSLEFHLLYYKD